MPTGQPTQKLVPLHPKVAGFATRAPPDLTCHGLTDEELANSFRWAKGQTVDDPAAVSFAASTKANPAFRRMTLERLCPKCHSPDLHRFVVTWVLWKTNGDPLTQHTLVSRSDAFTAVDTGDAHGRLLGVKRTD